MQDRHASVSAESLQYNIEYQQVMSVTVKLIVFEAIL